MPANESESSNGHHPADLPEAVNPNAEVITGEQLPEGGLYGAPDDPDINTLVDISSIYDANTQTEDADSGGARHPYVLAISLFLLLIFLVPVIIQIINFSH